MSEAEEILKNHPRKCTVVTRREGDKESTYTQGAIVGDCGSFLKVIHKTNMTGEWMAISSRRSRINIH